MAGETVTATTTVVARHIRAVKVLRAGVGEFVTVPAGPCHSLFLLAPGAIAAQRHVSGDAPASLPARAGLANQGIAQNLRGACVRTGALGHCRGTIPA